jgi:hypothetical protein
MLLARVSAVEIIRRLVTHRDILLPFHQDSAHTGDRLCGRNMLKRLTFLCILSLIVGETTDGYAASTLKTTCSGNLTNTRENGVTLGDCDLNFITVKQMDEIVSTCGIPGTIDTPAENQCRIRAVVSPDPISTTDKRRLYKVLELWSVDKR